MKSSWIGILLLTTLIVALSVGLYFSFSKGKSGTHQSYKFNHHPAPTLSNCQRLLPERRKVTVEEMKSLIQSQHQPLFIREDKFASKKWDKMNMEDLAKMFAKNDIKMRLMVSPTGIVGWYDARLVAVSIDPTTGQIWGQGVPCPLMPNVDTTPFLLPHLQHDNDPDNLNHYIRNDGKPNKTKYYVTPNERYYFRTLHSDKFKKLLGDAIPSAIPLDPSHLEHINFYVSSAGIITNLHVDGKSGAIIQLKGKKRVYLFPKSDIQYAKMHSRNHPLLRRSQIDGVLDETALRDHPSFQNARGYEVILEPGTWMYIPAGWLHYVESLSPETYSIITRFNK